MEFIISISRPVKSWSLNEGHGKSSKSNMLSENKKAKRLKQIEKIRNESENDLISVEMNTSIIMSDNT